MNDTNTRLRNEIINEDYFVKHKKSTHTGGRIYHSHNVLELSFVRHGTVRCSVSGESFTAERNSLMIFNNLDLHLLEFGNEEYDRYVLYIKPEYIEYLSSGATNLLECFFYRPFENSGLLTLTEEEGNELEGLLDKAIRLCENDDNEYGNDLSIKFAFGEILILCNRAYRRFHNIHSDGTKNDYKIIYSTIDYIKRNLAEEITLDSLAGNVYVDKHYLCKLFGRVTGVSPIKYVINCRLIKAKELLIQNYPVEEVCRKTGFNNLSHFSRTFKKEIGVSPKKFSLGAR